METIVIKTTDICAKGSHPEDILSNLCGNDFRFDEVSCGCMEGFLQSLKYQDMEIQRKICGMKGTEARQHSISEWQESQTVWWKGHAINRQSSEYNQLVRNAYVAMYLWCGRFRDALMSTVGKQLLYDSGRNDSHKTILTDQEFCKILTDLREERKDEYKRVLYPRMWPNWCGVEEDYIF